MLACKTKIAKQEENLFVFLGNADVLLKKEAGYSCAEWIFAFK